VIIWHGSGYPQWLVVPFAHCSCLLLFVVNVNFCLSLWCLVWRFVLFSRFVVRLSYFVCCMLCLLFASDLFCYRLSTLFLFGYNFVICYLAVLVCYFCSLFLSLGVLRIGHYPMSYYSAETSMQ